MHRVRSIWIPLLGCAAFAGAGCDSHVALGTYGASIYNVLWSATFETGDLSEWERDGDGNVYLENDSIPPTVTTEQAHGGQFAGKSTIDAIAGPPGMQSSSYFYRNQPSPTEAYYSAWFYIPSTSVVKTWLSLSHFRCSTSGDGMNVVPLWDLNAYPRLDGTLAPHFYDFYTTQTNAPALVPTTIPTDRWVHFEVLLRKAATATGRVAVWQDDVAIVDLQNVITAPTDWVQWDVGASSNDVEPAPSSVYVDDAAISLERLGPGTAADERTPSP